MLEGPNTTAKTWQKRITLLKILFRTKIVTIKVHNSSHCSFPRLITLFQGDCSWDDCQKTVWPCGDEIFPGGFSRDTHFWMIFHKCHISSHGNFLNGISWSVDYGTFLPKILPYIHFIPKNLQIFQSSRFYRVYTFSPLVSVYCNCVNHSLSLFSFLNGGNTTEYTRICTLYII